MRKDQVGGREKEELWLTSWVGFWLPEEQLRVKKEFEEKVVSHHHSGMKERDVKSGTKIGRRSLTRRFLFGVFLS